jgi:hypothetical protein
VSYNDEMRRLLATLVVLAFAAPAPALAQRSGTNAPPGNSAIDEYVESVPSANGSTPTRGLVGPKPQRLAGAAGRTLRAAGKDGRLLEQIVAATAPTAALKAAGKTKVSAALPAIPGSDAPGAKGRSPLSSVADAILTGSGGGSGMGAAFPLLLVALAAGTLVLGRRRRRPQS